MKKFILHIYGAILYIPACIIIYPYLIASPGAMKDYYQNQDKLIETMMKRFSKNTRHTSAEL